MITQKHAEDALRFLAETDEEFGRLKADMLASNERLKTEYARAYLGTNPQDKVDDRKSLTYISEAYTKALDERDNKVADYEITRNKRLRAELTIDLFRTVEASRRRGNVV